MAQSRTERGQPLIQLNNVSKRFRLHREKQRSIQDGFIRIFQNRRSAQEYFWPLRDVSLSIYPGDSVGVLGPNGSGKSTMLKLINGILEPTSGKITLRGQIASLLELGAGFHHDLTGRENIFLNGSVYGVSRTEMHDQLDSIIEFAELGDFIDTPVKHYSSGMYVRLGFSVAIHTDPDVLVVDEVLTVGDQVFQQKCLERIHELKGNGVAIVLVSHSLAEVERLCDRAVWLQNGLLRADGVASQVVDEYLAFSNDRYYQMRRTRDGRTLDREFDFDNSEKRWGTGDAVITKVELLDASDVEPEYFMTGDKVRLRIHYKTSKPVPTPVFGLAFHRRDGVHVNGPNSRQAGCDIARIDGSGIVEYAIDALPLNPGHYAVTAAIYNQTASEALDHHHRMYEFEVRATGLHQEEGVVHIPAAWRHLSGGQGRQEASETGTTDDIADSVVARTA